MACTWRPTRRRLLQTAGAAGAAALAWGGQRSDAAAQGIHRGGTLRIGLDGDPPTLDPHRSGSYVDRQVFQNLYDKLVDTDQNLKIVPMLATSWSISEDGKTATFKLRQGVRFHDGAPFNAEAAVYNFHRMLFDPTFPSVRRSELRPVQKVVATDAYTIQLIMDQPYSPLLYVLTDRAGMMVSPAAAQKEGLDFALRPVGTGPFEFADRVPQDHIMLRRNPNYWVRDLPYLDALIYRPFTDDNTRVANLKSGDLDVISLVPLPQVKTLDHEASQPDTRFRLIERSPIAWAALSLNVTTPPFHNKAARQALLAAVDQGVLAGVVLQGAAYPAYSFFPNGTPAYDPSWKLPPRNVALAREKLQQAAMPNGFEFTVITPPGEQHLAILQAVQSMAGEAGIRLKIEMLEGGVLLQRLVKLQNQAGFVDWSGRPDPDFDVYPFVTRSGIGAFNFAGYTNPQLQTILDRARAVYDIAARRTLYSQVTRILADDAPYVWMYFPKEYKLVSTKVGGFVDQPDGMMRFRSAWLAP
jgi:peptide/nickel transport system substrate-binding protein